MADDLSVEDKNTSDIFDVQQKMAGALANSQHAAFSNSQRECYLAHAIDLQPTLQLAEQA